MTVNKFGNYLFFTTQEHKLATLSPEQMITTSKSICITVKKKLKQGSVFYT